MKSEHLTFYLSLTKYDHKQRQDSYEGTVEGHLLTIRENNLYSLQWFYSGHSCWLLTQLLPSNLEVHFTSLLSWLARNINTDVY